MHANTAMGYWRDLLGIVRRVDSMRMALSRLDPTNIAGQHRQAVEAEIAAMQHTLALQANALTVYTLEAEMSRRLAQARA